MIFEKLAQINAVQPHYKQSFELISTLIVVYNFCCKSLRKDLSKIEVREPFIIKKYTRYRITNDIVYLYFTFEVNQITLIAKVVVKKIGEKLQKEFTLSTANGGYSGVPAKGSKRTRTRITDDSC